MVTNNFINLFHSIFGTTGKNEYDVILCIFLFLVISAMIFKLITYAFKLR